MQYLRFLLPPNPLLHQFINGLLKIVPVLRDLAQNLFSNGELDAASC